MLKAYKYTLSGLTFSLTILLIGGCYHYLNDGGAAFHYLPQSPHDRRMALIVSAILIILGFCADRNTKLLLAHEEEKRRIFASTVAAAQHVLNNFLNNMLYFQEQARQSQALDEKTLKLYDAVIHDAAEQLKKLGEISEVSEKNIRDTIYPK